MLPHVFPIASYQVGDVAQLGERGVRNAEARGSIPLISTIPYYCKEQIAALYLIIKVFLFFCKIIPLNIENLC